MNVNYKSALDLMLEYTTYECSMEHGACITALKKQMPQKPIHIHEEYAEHDWQRDKNGKIDTGAWGVGFCNGPICKRCFHSECEWCNPDWETNPEDPCVVDEDRCPTCNNTIAVVGKFCTHCGQALDWGD
jgi:hypothetical protein